MSCTVSTAIKRRRGGVAMLGTMVLALLVVLGTPPAAAGGSTQIARSDYDRVGEASWYGSRYQGRTTASGEKFDMNGLTAAHRRLPFGTHVRVTNLANKRSVVVRINDRGPYARGRLIDLSRRGAELLGFEHQGVVRVRVEALLTKQSIQSSLRQSRNFDPIKLRPPRIKRRR